MASTSARATPDVNLSTVEQVQHLLEEAETPVTRYYLRKRLAEAGHATVSARLNRALAFFFDLGLAVEGSKGIQWTHTRSESLRRAATAGRRL